MGLELATQQKPRKKGALQIDSTLDTTLLPPQEEERRSPLLFCRLPYGFAVDCLSWIAILCSFQVNPCLLVKQLAVLFLRLTV